MATEWQKYTSMRERWLSYNQVHRMKMHVERRIHQFEWHIYEVCASYLRQDRVWDIKWGCTNEDLKVDPSIWQMCKKVIWT